MPVGDTVTTASVVVGGGGAIGASVANGSSGHGVMHAPPFGQLLAQMMTDGRATSLDVTALRPERFDEGTPNPSSDVL